jgi:hypothetical protein
MPTGFLGRPTASGCHHHVDGAPAELDAPVVGKALAAIRQHPERPNFGGSETFALPCTEDGKNTTVLASPCRKDCDESLA